MIFEDGERVYCKKYGYGWAHKAKGIKPIRYLVRFDCGKKETYQFDGKFALEKKVYKDFGVTPEEVDLEKLVFEVGETVYSPNFGEGTVEEVTNRLKACYQGVVYRLYGLKGNVILDSMEENIHHVFKNGEYQYLKAHKFEDGETVYTERCGYGTLRIVPPCQERFEYEVSWFNSTYDYFFKDGRFGLNKKDYDECHTSPEEADLEKLKFKVGEKVTSIEFGEGKVIAVNPNMQYPVTAMFKDEIRNFTEIGLYPEGMHGNIHHVDYVRPLENIDRTKELKQTIYSLPRLQQQYIKLIREYLAIETPEERERIKDKLKDCAADINQCLTKTEKCLEDMK